MKLGYSGELTIIHNDSKFIAHNNGTRHLFQLLTSILSGNDFSMKNLPAKFDLVNKSVSQVLTDGTINPNDSVLTSRLIITKNMTIDSDQNPHLEITSVLSSGNISNTSTSITGNLTLVLLPNDGDTVLAAVDYNVNSYNQLQRGGQAQLIWTLTIENK